MFELIDIYLYCFSIFISSKRNNIQNLRLKIWKNILYQTWNKTFFFVFKFQIYNFIHSQKLHVSLPYHNCSWPNCQWQNYPYQLLSKQAIRYFSNCRILSQVPYFWPKTNSCLWLFRRVPFFSQLEHAYKHFWFCYLCHWFRW